MPAGRPARGGLFAAAAADGRGGSGEAYSARARTSTRRPVRAVKSATMDARQAKYSGNVQAGALAPHLCDEDIAFCYAVKVDALTLLGEFLEKQPKAKGTLRRGTKTEPRQADSPPALASAGISKKVSSVSQKLSRMKREAPSTARAAEVKVPKENRYPTPRRSAAVGRPARSSLPWQ